MKKAMSQSLLTLILNGISILSLIFLVISLLSYRNVNNQLYSANEERFNLTYNANRFMNGSARCGRSPRQGFRSIMTITGMRSIR